VEVDLSLNDVSRGQRVFPLTKSWSELEGFGTCGEEWRVVSTSWCTEKKVRRKL